VVDPVLRPPQVAVVKVVRDVVHLRLRAHAVPPPHQKAVPRGARKVAPPLDHPVVVAPRLVEHDAEPLPARVRDGPDVVDDAHVLQALVREEEPRHGALLHQVHAAAHLECH